MKWLNQILDAHAFWSHDHARRDVFLTSDNFFSKRLIGLSQFPDTTILEPKEAVRLIDWLS
jgi:hypothetical protein